jgi:integrase
VDDFATVAVQFIQRYAKPKNRGWKETARLIGLIPDSAAPTDDPAIFVAHKDGAVKKWGHRKIADITRADVNRFLDGIVDRGSPIAANRVFAALRKLFGWAETRYALSANPCDRVERPSAEVSRDRLLTDDELKAVWEAAGELGWPFGPFVQLLILTGQRLNEVAGISWSELDLEKRLWTLPRGRVKNDKGHEVPLSAQAIQIIKSVPRIAGRDLLFSTTGTSPISGFSKTKATIDEKSGVTGWTFHDLRRTLASGMARLGINLPVIEKILNHSSGSFRGIVGVYQRHSFADEKRAALDVWGAHLARLVG